MTTTEAIDFRFLLIENYKKLKISELELATLFVIDHLISQGNSIITVDLLSLKMSLKTEQLDKILASLLEKGFIDYITKQKHTITTLAPLRKKLFKEFEISLANEQKGRNSKKASDSLENIYTSFESLLSRPLSPLEISRIREWISYSYSDEMIINALKEAISKNKRGVFKAVDKILLAWSNREDIEKEGRSHFSEDWTKNIEETIRIAQTPWIVQDDEKDK